MKEKSANELNRFAAALMKDCFAYAPVRRDGRLLVREAKDPKEIDWSGEIPDNSWKEILMPHRERLFDLDRGKISAVKGVQPLAACLGMNILDLKALALYDEVFSNDVYYQNRRKNLIIVGFSSDWPNDYKRFKVFSHNFELSILHHVPFDIFIAGLKGGRLKFYSGSEKGRRLLERYGLNDFDHIEFNGAAAESGSDKRLINLADKVENSSTNSLWDVLNDICLACGKCTIVCPTCFCFNFADRLDAADTRRDRVQGNCFYNDFSKVAGGHKELATVRAKIYFWYVHKFVRIPKEYGLPGCVSCGRCVKACLVGIDIFKNIAKLEKSKFK
ncbi:MAG: 4Fe-4S dicluster domain-containing protein [Patescibacteria group bacterium]